MAEITTTLHCETRYFKAALGVVAFLMRLRLLTWPMALFLAGQSCRLILLRCGENGRWRSAGPRKLELVDV